MLKSVAVVTGACAARSRKPYPFSSTMLPSLNNARTAPGTLCADMRRSISASEAEESAADTEAASVTTATAIPTAHVASGRPHQLRFIVLAPIITIKFRWRTLRGGGRSRQDGIAFCSQLTRRVVFRGCIALAQWPLSALSFLYSREMTESHGSASPAEMLIDLLLNHRM